MGVNRENQSNNTVELILSAFGAAWIAVCSWLIVPGTVPFTLQTFAVYSILCLFGAKIALRSVIVYIILGACGVPVFSGFSAGLGVLLGTTGGYIIGFVFISMVYAWTTKSINNKPLLQILSLAAGTLVCYIFGTVWFVVVYAGTNGSIAWSTALMWCVVPFIIPDMVKITAAVWISQKLNPIYAAA